MFGLISKKKVISIFAKELAAKQKQADRWYYVHNDQVMSSYCLELVDEIKALAIKFGITKEVYDKAYKIYDFRNSGKAGYEPDLESLKKVTD